MVSQENNARIVQRRYGVLLRSRVRRRRLRSRCGIHLWLKGAKECLAVLIERRRGFIAILSDQFLDFARASVVFFDLQMEDNGAQSLVMA